MRKIFLLVLCLTLSFSIFAQSKKEDAVKAKLASETCDCIKASGVDFSNKEAVQTQLGVCVIQAIGENEKAVSSLKLDFSDEIAMRNFGREIGFLVVGKCPEIFMGIVQEKIEQDKETVSHSIEGVIEGIEEGEFVTLTIKDANGRSHKVYWVGFFENADQLKENYNSLKGKKVTLFYKEQEYYQPKIQDYAKMKVITKVELE